MLFNAKKNVNEAEELLEIPQGSWADIWYSLKRNKRAMFGLGFIIFVNCCRHFR